MKKLKILLFFSLFIITVPFSVFAEREKGISLAISPLLTRINVAPGDSWSGFVEVFNSSEKDLHFTIILKDFRGGEEGRVEFIDTREIEKSIDKGKEFLLSQWININRDLIFIPAKESKALPVEINIPKHAGPGGKYAIISAAAIAEEDISSGTSVMVSPSVGSLVLLNVRGDVIEEAFLREFSTKRTLYTKPEVSFDVRLRNEGNTHIHPRGNITIYNQWDRVVENFLINHNTEFGNVLPQSERRWNFVWDGKESLFEMGRYKASLTLVYGEEVNRTITQDVYFWIIPLDFFLMLLGIVLFLLVIVTIAERFKQKYMD